MKRELLNRDGSPMRKHHSPLIEELLNEIKQNMKENELRIGNWVRHCAAWSYRQDADDFEEFNFQWKLEDFYALCECTLDIDNVEYIPLTEEWLLKFGFETSDWDNNSTYRKMIGNNDYTIVFDEYSNTMVGDILIKEIKYVHQLQNLYFTLTGEEITK